DNRHTATIMVVEWRRCLTAQAVTNHLSDIVSLLYRYLCNPGKWLTLLVTTGGEVTDSKNVRMTRNAQVWCHYDATSAIKLHSSGCGENTVERRFLHASRPYHRAGCNPFVLLITAYDNCIGLYVGYCCAGADANP